MASKKITVRIPRPCTENWDAMSPSEKGRLCSVCEKTVVDFTSMSDGRMASVLHANPGTCGKYYTHQLNREIEIPRELSTWRQYVSKAAAATVLLSLSSFKKASAQADIKNTASPVEATTSLQPYSNSIRCKILQPDADSLKIHKLVFRQDAFVFTADSIIDKGVSFQVPFGIQNNFYFELYSNDSMFNVEVREFNSVSEYSREIYFTYTNGSWTYIVSRSDTPFTSAEANSPIHLDTDTPILVTLSGGDPNVLWGITGGVPNEPDEPVNAFLNPMSKNWQVFYLPQNKTSRLWWLLLLPVFIAGRACYKLWKRVSRKETAGQS